MASPTQPTVPLPTPTDIDDDDDDNDQGLTTFSQPSATSIAGQTLTPTPLPGSPPPAASSAIAVPSSSVTGLPDSLPSGGVQDTVVPGNAPSNNDQRLSPGATAGIAVGVALAVILIIVGGWFWIRRRRSRVRKTRTNSGGSTVPDHVSDEETAKKSEVYAYRAPGAVEVEGAQDVTGGDRRRSELASPTVPVEVTGDRHFAIELQGSEVPVRMDEK